MKEKKKTQNQTNQDQARKSSPSQTLLSSVLDIHFRKLFSSAAVWAEVTRKQISSPQKKKKTGLTVDRLLSPEELKQDVSFWM